MPLIDRVKRSLGRRTDEFIRRSPLLRKWRIDEAVHAQEVKGGSITNVQIIAPAAERVSLGTNEHDAAFLKVCKYFREGWYSRDATITCEVPDAYLHVGSGVVCTRDWKAVIDAQMMYRLEAPQAAVGNKLYRPYKWFKPSGVKKLTGTYTTIGNVFMMYWGHWLFDCLPRFRSLAMAAAGEKVTLLIQDNLPQSFRDSLACVLPSNFTIETMPSDTWVQVDRLLLASYASGRTNSHQPREFYDYVRHACFAKFGLTLENQPSERIYVSRAGTRHRRVVNEVALMELLSKYGFKSVALEKLSFKEQVELFHRAEIVIAADGSNWANMIFAGKIKVFVLYASHEPNMHWFTAAKGLGQEHYFTRANEESQHSDFSVDLAEVERVLRDEMKLAPSA